MVTEFKQQLKAKVKHMEKKPLPVLTFPDDPSDLPKGLYDAVFGEELPSPPKICNAGAEASVVVARKSHNSVKKKLQFDSNNPMMLMNQLSQMNVGGMNPMMLMMAGMQSMMQGESAGNQGPNLQIFGNKKRKQKALTDGSPEDDSQGSQGSPKEEEVEAKPAKSMFSLTLPGPNADTKDAKHAKDAKDAKDANAAKVDKSPDTYLALMDKSFKKRSAARSDSKVDVPEEDQQDDARGDDDVPPAKPTKGKKRPATKNKDDGQKQKDGVNKASAPSAKVAAKKSAKKEVAEPKAGNVEAKKPRKDLGAKPSPPEPWQGTFFWGSGKVHKNPSSSNWRAFVEKSDKKDRKVKLGEDQTASFHRALEIIEEGMHERGL